MAWFRPSQKTLRWVTGITDLRGEPGEIRGSARPARRRPLQNKRFAESPRREVVHSGHALVTRPAGTPEWARMTVVFHSQVADSNGDYMQWRKFRQPGFERFFCGGPRPSTAVTHMFIHSLCG
jgi:hypothetical protein